jgi:hypothetical protein
MTIELIERIIEKELESFKKSVTEISKEDNSDESICVSEKEFVDYDAVVGSSVKTGEPLSSPDMVYFSGEKVVFVEFENGKIHSKDKKQLKLKGIEGGYIALYDILKSFSHDEISFKHVQTLKKAYYVVYNQQTNPSSRAGGITAHLEGQQIRFGLKKYEGTFFRK